MPFANQVALVTGGSSGIGLALARQLAGQGAHVWLLARQVDRLERALADILLRAPSSDQRCGILSADVADPRQIRRVIQQLVEQVGFPHLVINSAGITHPGKIQELSGDVFSELIQVNYLGTVNVISAILPGMIDRRSGHIVNLSSIAGFIGVYGYSAYCGSKFALRGYSDVLRSEMKSCGIQVSIVYPGDTDTPQFEAETELRPAIARELASVTSPLSAERVAREILRGVARKKYVILPGFDVKAIYYSSALIGNGIYPIMDFLVARAHRKLQKGSSGHA